MVSHDWLSLVLWVALLILWEPLAPTPNVKIRSQIVFQDIKATTYIYIYIYIYVCIYLKFWSWFLNKTPIRMCCLQQLRGVIFTTSFHWAAVITAAFSYDTFNSMSS
jgi:hypothetical protein